MEGGATCAGKGSHLLINMIEDNKIVSNLHTRKVCYAVSHLSHCSQAG